MGFKNAFNCKKCPESNGKNGCPCFWEIPWENQETGEVAVRKGCILSQEMGLPIVQAIVRAAHVASEHASVVRNSIERGFEMVAQIAETYQRPKIEHTRLRAIEGPEEVE